MLRNTFLHIPGFGPKAERSIWEAGINSWDDFLAGPALVPMAAAKRGRALGVIQESVSALDAGNAAFFARRLPSREAWRAYPAFQESAVFLDIETTGLSADCHAVTCIGLYPARAESAPRLFVKGINLEEFVDEIADYRLVITYNGATFDLPFLRAQFPYAGLPPLHLDLRYVLRRLGHSGGLKRIERAIGIERDERIRGMDGFDAVHLWHEYEEGSVDSLRLLLEYNLADIVGLKGLTEFAYNGMLSQVACHSPLLPLSGRALRREEIAECLRELGV